MLGRTSRKTALVAATAMALVGLVGGCGGGDDDGDDDGPDVVNTNGPNVNDDDGEQGED
jgi:hypothetical protein